MNLSKCPHFADWADDVLDPAVLNQKTNRVLSRGAFPQEFRLAADKPRTQPPETSVGCGMKAHNPAKYGEILECGEARVLSTSACRSWLDRLTAFENTHFGSDFSWSVEQNKIWAASGAAFHAAIIRGDPECYISASMSLLLVSESSRESFMAGKLHERELVPWTPTQDCEPPVLYFASVISCASAELPFLYGSLAADVLEYFDSKGVKATRGFAISAGVAGRQHLERNGFCLAGGRYLNKYDFLTITAETATTLFWQRVLSAAEIPLSAELQSQACASSL